APRSGRVRRACRIHDIESARRDCRRNRAPASESWLGPRRELRTRLPGPHVLQNKFHGAMAKAAVAVVEQEFCAWHGGRHSAKHSTLSRRRFPARVPETPELREAESASGQSFGKSLSWFLRVLLHSGYFSGENAFVKCNSILDAIGRTPLVRLNRVAKNLPAEVYVKADYLNPGGSMKDRIAVHM